MSEPNDLLGKADAFLKRFHPSSPAARHDVPVLTEVVAEGRESPPQADPSASAGAPAKVELLELEHRLRQSILDSIASHVANAVEGQVQARIETVVQRALAALSGQLKPELEAHVREAVARAVAAEITRLRGPSRGT